MSDFQASEHMQAYSCTITMTASADTTSDATFGDASWQILSQILRVAMSAS